MTLIYIIVEALEMPTRKGRAIQERGGSELETDTRGDLVIRVVLLAQGGLVEQERLDAVAEHGAGADAKQEVVGILLVGLVGEAVGGAANRVGDQPAANRHRITLKLMHPVGAQPGRQDTPGQAEGAGNLSTQIEGHRLQGVLIEMEVKGFSAALVITVQGGLKVVQMPGQSGLGAPVVEFEIVATAQAGAPLLGVWTGAGGEELRGHPGDQVVDVALQIKITSAVLHHPVQKHVIAEEVVGITGQVIGAAVQIAATVVQVGTGGRVAKGETGNESIGEAVIHPSGDIVGIVFEAGFLGGAALVAPVDGAINEDTQATTQVRARLVASGAPFLLGERLAQSAGRQGLAVLADAKPGQADAASPVPQGGQSGQDIPQLPAVEILAQIGGFRVIARGQLVHDICGVRRVGDLHQLATPEQQSLSSRVGRAILEKIGAGPVYIEGHGAFWRGGILNQGCQTNGDGKGSDFWPTLSVDRSSDPVIELLAAGLKLVGGDTVGAGLRLSRAQFAGDGGGQGLTVPCGRHPANRGIGDGLLLLRESH